MTTEAIRKLDEKTGSSRQAIVKYIIATYALEAKLANQHTKVALKNAVKNGALKQSKGVGASGSFKLGDALKNKDKAAAKKAVAAAKPKDVKPAAPAKKVVVKPKAAAGDAKPKKNVKKIVKPTAPKVEVKKAPVKAKVVTKEAAKAKLPSAASKPKTASVKVQIAAKKTVQKKAVPVKKAAAKPKVVAKPKVAAKPAAKKAAAPAASS